MTMFKVDQIVCEAAEASSIVKKSVVQNLWSGYGELNRYLLEGGKYPSVIVKHIKLPEKTNHPRGWNTHISHQRKLASYQVERNWYENYADKTNEKCRVPKSLHTEEADNELLLIMEDLDAIGYPKRLTPATIDLRQAKNCLTWLASFHAKFMGVAPEGLWPVGTYWHLDTRPDEWNQMQNHVLKAAARDIDQKLNKANYQTLVHGDAKLANFCFSENGGVAAVDFQYVGKGCGMKDVAYFISSCFEEEACELYEELLLNHYFNQLKWAIDNKSVYQSVKQEWSELYKYAWADFYRFLDGWSPSHWKMHDYSKRITQEVLNELKC